MGNNPSYFKGELNRPVEQVSWYDCQEFIKKLNNLSSVKESGLVFCLPTQKEWEYACRACSKGRYGKTKKRRNSNLGDMGWYFGNSDETHPVGQKKPNVWGLYDMHGNVWEWIASTEGDEHICCGGGFSWYSPSTCEANSTDRHLSDYRGHSVGFRFCARRSTAK